MTPRAYRSNVRVMAARSTRESILRSARTLFAEQGYARTSVAAIAEHAQVALNTIYTSVGAKPALILALVEQGAADSLIEDALARIAAETDGVKILRITADHSGAVTRQQSGLLQVLLDNRTSEPAVEAAAAAAVQRYRERLAQIATRLETVGALRAGVNENRAADVMWFYFGVGGWSTIRELGWDWPEATDWLHQQAVVALLR